MVYDILSNMQRAGELAKCQIYFSPEEGKTDVVLGFEVNRINRSFMLCSTGDMGLEEMKVMLEWICAVVMEGKSVWEKKKRIQKVYPR
jgi:hypothetical protein